MGEEVTYNPRLVHLPGTTLTPEVVLHRTLNKLDRVKAVVIVIQWDDDSYDADWSQMKVSELVMADMLLDSRVRDIVSGKEPVPF